MVKATWTYYVVLGAASIIPAADAPKSAEEMSKFIEKGGKHWSAPETAPDLDPFKEAAGDRFWIWPVEDKVLKVKVSKPMITLSWRLRPGQKAIDSAEQEVVKAEIRGKTAGSQFGLRGSIEGIEQAVAEGKCKITPGPAIKDYCGEGELLLFIASRGIKPSSNLLRVKVKITD